MSILQDVDLKALWQTPIQVKQSANPMPCEDIQLTEAPFPSHVETVKDRRLKSVLGEVSSLFESFTGHPVDDASLAVDTLRLQAPDARCQIRSTADLRILICAGQSPEENFPYEILLHDPRIAASQSTIPGGPFGRSLRFPALGGLTITYPGWIALSLLPTGLPNGLPSGSKSSCHVVVFEFWS